MPRKLEIIETLLGGFATRLLLSVAIIASIVVHELPLWAQLSLLGLFGTEVALRTTVLAWQLRHGQRPLGGIMVLLVDILATLSFLPFAAADSDFLRLGRVARLVLLLTYWGPLARDFLRLALQRERLSQLLLVGGMATVLTGLGASALRVIDIRGADIDGDGIGDMRRPSFADLLWWAFRQVEDPGNLVPSMSNPALALLSLTLTTGGLLLVAVIIGIGASLVEDLARAGRARRVNLRGHMVVLNVTESARGILANIHGYFRKQVGRRRIAVQGATAERPPFLDGDTFRKFQYRHGSPADRADLQLLDVDRARRVAILSPGLDGAADAEAVAAVMSTRMLNKKAWIVVELNNPSNIPAALIAGHERTIPVPARRLAALVLAQDLVDPGRARLLLNLVSLEGDELYTCILADGRLNDLPRTMTLDRPFGALRRTVHATHGVLLLGYFLDAGEQVTPWLRGMIPVLNPPSGDQPTVRGLFALAPRFSRLEAAVRAIHDRTLPGLSELPPPEQRALPLTPDVPLSPRHVIVLGFHQDTVETVGELLRIFPRCEVTIVGADETARNRMRQAFLSERMETGATFRAPDPKRLQVHQADGTICGTIHIRVADRYAEGLFRPGDTSGPVGNLFDYDAAIILSEHEGAPHPDAACVLAVLKVLDHWDPVTRLQHVVAEVTDRDKAALLTRRVADMQLDDRISFVRTGELREDILNHSFFVPGLPPVLHDLMTAGHHELFALQPSRAEGAVSFAELIDNLQVRSPPLVPLAVVDSAGLLRVNPPPDERLPWAEIRTIYCLGTAPRV